MNARYPHDQFNLSLFLKINDTGKLTLKIIKTPKLTQFFASNDEVENKGRQNQHLKLRALILTRKKNPFSR